MSELLKSVDMRTKLAGENRMELLLFRLNTKQRYGINVFKVREVYRNLALTILPDPHPAVLGVTYFRGTTIPVIDLNYSLNRQYCLQQKERIVIISEFNRTMQGLIVSSVDRIINTDWQKIQPPPPASFGKNGSYVIAITEFENEVIEVIDVEKVLDEINPGTVEVSASVLQESIVTTLHDKEILIADDSIVARRKINRALDQLGVKVISTNTGQEAWNLLQSWADNGTDIYQKILMLITDLEMPEMDGYTLTKKIRQDPRLKDLFIVIHSSMSGEFNEQLVSKVGANKFMAKFQPDAFAEMVKIHMQELKSF